MSEVEKIAEKVVEKTAETTTEITSEEAEGRAVEKTTEAAEKVASHESKSGDNSDSEGSNQELSLGLDVVRGIKPKCKPEYVASFFSSTLRLPEGYSVRCPDEDDRICSPRDGEVGVYMKNFDQGLRFPVEPFIVGVLNFLRVSIAQLYPNAFFTITTFSALCKVCEIEPTVNLYRHFFTKKDASDAGYLSLCARRGRTIILELPTSIKDWKANFVFVKSSEPFPFPTSWAEANPRIKKEVKLSEEEETQAAMLMSCPEEKRVALELVEPLDKRGKGRRNTVAKKPQGKGKSKKALRAAMAEAQAKKGSPPYSMPSMHLEGSEKAAGEKGPSELEVGGGSRPSAEARSEAIVGSKRPAESSAEAALSKKKKKKKTKVARDSAVVLSEQAEKELGLKKQAEIEISPAIEEPTPTTGQAEAGEQTPAGGRAESPVEILHSEEEVEGTAEQGARQTRPKKDKGKVGMRQRFRPPKRFLERDWSEKERDLLELILYRVPGDPKYDDPVEMPYVPPHPLDVDDSALTDPTVAARVALNAYLPADRREMKVFDNDVLMANAVKYVQNAMNMVTEAQMRMAEVDRARMSFMAFKDMYDEATANNAELKGLLDVLNADTVKELVGLLKSKNEALDFEKKMNADRLAEVERLNERLIESNDKLVGSEATLRETQEELGKKEAELTKASSDLKSLQDNYQSEIEKSEGDRRQFALREEEWKAEKAKLVLELNKLKSETSAKPIPEEVVDAFGKGFESCQHQIARKFPQHGLDFSQLDVLEDSSDSEESGDEEEEDDDEDGADQ